MEFCPSDPATINYIALAGDGAAVVGREKQHQSSDFFGREHAFQGLVIEDFRFVFLREPQLSLALGEDGSGENAIDANITGSQLVSQCAGHSDNRGLGGDVNGQSCGRNDPADGAEIDDGAAAGFFHRRNYRLTDEKLVPEIHGHRAVPVVRGNVVDFVARIVAGVVDEHVDRLEFFEDARDAGANRGDISEVASKKKGFGNSSAANLFCDLYPGLILNIEIRDLRALMREMFNNVFADPAGSACDNSDTATETGVGGEPRKFFALR
jgi:hypothetical protein